MNLIKIITSYILLYIASFLFFIISFFILIPSLIYSLFKGHLNRYFFDLAYSIDQLGNVLIQHIANIILIKKGGYPFGHPDETISSVLGRNQINGSLKSPGKLIVKFLDLIDKHHCINAIESNLKERRV